MRSTSARRTRRPTRRTRRHPFPSGTAARPEPGWLLLRRRVCFRSRRLLPRRLRRVGLRRVGLLRRFDVEVGNAELALERVQLLEVDVADDVHDREFSRFARDDAEAHGLAVVEHYEYVDIGVFLVALRLDDAAPARTAELPSHGLDLCLRIREVLVERVAAHVDAREAIAELLGVDLLGVLRIEEPAAHAEQLLVECHGDRLTGFLRERGEFGDAEPAFHWRAGGRDH